MQTKINIQSLSELQKVAKFGGKKVNLQKKPLIFPMEVFTEVPKGNKREMTFEEFSKKHLK